MRKSIKKYTVILCLTALCALLFVGWAAAPKDYPEGELGNNGSLIDYYYAPHLIAKGQVTNEQGEPLEGIRVAIYGVREETEKDLLTYNYNLTDSAGEYTIVRYAGRKTLTEVTLVATDTTNVYAEQTIFAPVVYEQVETKYGNKYNVIVTADFVLHSR